ncbi:expressed unknown protein [Seminavis robusta]|uniref:Uncharacterized protein n=1 Tax=Seminavis robusta TaxID=568900 RepID=A0A9N8ERU0_9STRA|nr:expressed unknown protein [Seminavis robusta]|eukprot:Sro1506_g278260.1 n/a (220) ;mRNA; r:6796-7455
MTTDSHSYEWTKKRPLDPESSVSRSRDPPGRSFLPPLKKRHLDVPVKKRQDAESPSPAPPVVASTTSALDKNNAAAALIANHPAIQAMQALKNTSKQQQPAVSLSPQDIAARLKAFEEAQRRSKASRELLAKATQELQRAKQVQQEQRLVKLMAIKAALLGPPNSSSSNNSTASSLQQGADGKTNLARLSLGLGSCGSRSGSLALGGTDVLAAMTGAAW